MMDGSGGMFFGGGFMWIFWLLVIVAIAAAVKTMMGGNAQRRGSEKDSPLSILEKPYARGGIVMPNPIPKRFLRAALAGIAALFLTTAAFAADSGLHKVVHGVAIYLGVFPAEMVLGHPRAHAEAQMHGGVPAGQHRYHVVVALFDNATGKRISGAGVKANVAEIGLSGVQKKLEPMLIGGTVSYGNYFNMPSTSNPYRINVRIELPGVADVIEAQFDYRHARA